MTGEPVYSVELVDKDEITLRPFRMLMGNHDNPADAQAQAGIVLEEWKDRPETYVEVTCSITVEFRRK